jgi:predicted metal-binding membrane protein
MTASPILESVLKRDRALVVAGLAGVTVLAWVYLIDMALGMRDMSGMGSALVTARADAWSPLDAIMMFVMWWVMMVGMMVPSAAPMILLFAAINRKKRADGKPYVPTGLFALAYVAVWAGFSLVAVLAQWGMQSAGLLSPAMQSTNAWLGGGVLIAAGLYQWTPIKDACLKNCQSPFGFIMTHWREGSGGALRMGLHHGAYCVGCCWFLMALLFVGGVMNLLWVAGLAIFVFAEKLGPRGPLVPRLAGALLTAWGVWVLAAGV